MYATGHSRRSLPSQPPRMTSLLQASSRAHPKRPAGLEHLAAVYLVAITVTVVDFFLLRGLVRDLTAVDLVALSSQKGGFRIICASLSTASLCSFGTGRKIEEPVTVGGLGQSRSSQKDSVRRVGILRRLRRFRASLWSLTTMGTVGYSCCVDDPVETVDDDDAHSDDCSSPDCSESSDSPSSSLDWVDGQKEAGLKVSQEPEAEGRSMESTESGVPTCFRSDLIMTVTSPPTSVESTKSVKIPEDVIAWLIREAVTRREVFQQGERGGCRRGQFYPCFRATVSCPGPQGDPACFKVFLAFTGSLCTQVSMDLIDDLGGNPAQRNPELIRSYKRAELHDEKIGCDLGTLCQTLEESRVLEGTVEQSSEMIRRRGQSFQRLTLTMVGAKRIGPFVHPPGPAWYRDAGVHTEPILWLIANPGSGCRDDDTPSRATQ
ncbi:hypothetical protein Z043_102435 [Scleropages formosus]|uniref:Uncharacterized protein n=1 Tax=Scleropages formosus TaxID=113540 RepID=A0A0P7XRU3_SCLFO|nr:hypothetical protein Z043_102435 [Scleropages formosus]